MKFCLGTVQFGTNYGIQGNIKPKRERIFEMLNYAISHNIESIDTASAYGDAEDVLGSYIKLFPEMVGNVKIVSKLRPNAFDDSSYVDWKEIAENDARKSLLRIGVDHFDAYLFHNSSYIFDDRAVMALNNVKEKGLTDSIGVSVYTPEEAMKALDYEDIGVVQIPYNVFDRRLDKCGFFDKAMEKGVKVYARSSLLQGLLMMDPDNLPERVKFAKEYLIQYTEICETFNITKLDAAIGYVALKSGIDYVVFGVDDLSQLEEYIAMQEIILPEDMIKRINEVFANVEEKLVNPVLWK